jgi:hypothetical protein
MVYVRKRICKAYSRRTIESPEKTAEETTDRRNTPRRGSEPDPQGKGGRKGERVQEEEHIRYQVMHE